MKSQSDIHAGGVILLFLVLWKKRKQTKQNKNLMLNLFCGQRK